LSREFGCEAMLRVIQGLAGGLSNAFFKAGGGRGRRNRLLPGRRGSWLNPVNEI
jgi:hypothetical protein